MPCPQSTLCLGQQQPLFLTVSGQTRNIAALAKALVTEKIPRWGVQAKISSDNDSRFVNAAPP